MAVGPQPCPATEVLEGLALGGAIPPEVAAHLTACATCRQALDRIRDDNRFLKTFLADSVGRPSVPAATPKIPGYEIQREVHRGGQGVVYQAVQTSTKRDVAIKVMNQGPLATLADRARFEREVETLAGLDHPNIVAVHDAGAVAGFQYFVMDYVDGAPLDEVFADWARGAGAERPLRTRAGDLLRGFVKVCDAVHAAHLRGVIHRDLKPSNIRVDRAGEPHVLDFGLAKSIVAEGDSAITRTGQFVGSLPWASPEQVAGAEIDLRTDVYSLGAILYQLLTGTVPFEVGSNLRDAFDAILQRDPPRPSTLAARFGVRIDEELETIVLKCLSKDRERRYQSAGELARDLRRYAAGEPIDAKRDSAWYLIRKVAWRRRWALGAVCVPIVLLPIAGYALHRSSLAARQAGLERSLREVESVRNAAMLEITRRLYARPGSAPDSPGGRLSKLNADALFTDLDTGGLSVSDHGVAMLLAEALRDRGSIIQAEGLVRRALFMLRRDHGPDHPEMGRMRLVLADLLLRRGTRMPEAQQMAEQAVAELTGAFGAASPEVARGLTMLARVRLARGDAPGALQTAQQAWAADDDPRSIPHVEAHAVLARVQEALGQRDEARRNCLDALRSMLLLTHDTDARLLDVVELSAGLVSRGVVPAEELLESAYLRGALHDMSPADALGEAAAVLRGGADGSARDTHIVPARFVMVGLRERLLGATDPSLGASLASAATSQFDAEWEEGVFRRGPVEESLALLQRAIPLQIAAHGPDSPLVGKSYEAVGTCLVDLFRLHEAARWFAQDCELWMRQPPELRDEYQIMVRARWTAWHATRAGDYERGLHWADVALGLVARVLGPEHSGAAMMHACRVLCLTELGRVPEAHSSEQCAVRILDTQPVPVDQRWDCARFLGLAYLAQGRPDDARAVLEPVWQTLEANIGQQRPSFRLEWARSMRTYFRAIGEPTKAEQCASWIRREAMGDVDAADLDDRPAAGPGGR